MWASGLKRRFFRRLSLGIYRNICLVRLSNFHVHPIRIDRVRANLSSMKKHQLLFLSSIISGICIGTSYIPFPPWALLFCYVPLWSYWLQEKSSKNIFLSGWLCQFIFTLIGFNWVAHTVHEFGRLPWVVAILVLIIYCGFANLQIPIAGWIWHKVFSKSVSKNQSLGWKVVSLVTVTSISERLFPMIFDWHFGYTWLWARLPAFQLADLVGFFGLSTLTFFLQGLVLYFWKTKTNAMRMVGLGYALALFGALNIWGHLHTPNPDSENLKTYRFAVIQANIGNLEKQVALSGNSFRQSIIDRYLDLSQQEAQHSPDFYVWPETAFPDILTATNTNGFYGRQVLSFLERVSGTLITGSYSRSERNLTTNSMLFLGGQGFLAEPYHKTNLLAFGEYLPFGSLFPILKTWVPQVSDFDRGHGPTVRLVQDLRIGGQICYEGLFDRFSRGLANQDAQVLVNLTNDSWFGDWQEPWQHLYMTLSRAIEVRRPLIRSTNTGISTAITSDGKVLTQSPMSQPWSYTFDLPVAQTPPKTFFMGFGYWVFPTILIFLLLACLLQRWRKN